MNKKKPNVFKEFEQLKVKDLGIIQNVIKELNELEGIELPLTTEEKNKMKDMALLLCDEAVRLSYQFPNDVNTLLGLLDIGCDMLRNSDMPVIYIKDSMRSTIFNNFTSTKPTERDLVNWFKKDFENIIGSSFELVNKENNSKHQPDLWFTSYDSYAPLEAKLGRFDNKALQQLRRYMKHYNCKIGIALGEEITCNEGDNSDIIFIKYTDYI